MDHVVIVGAGAMGCLFAARLAEAGRNVTLVDVDRDRIEALSKDGILLHDANGERRIKVSATLAPQVRECDLVLFFTKGMHTAAAAQSVAHLASTGCYALTLQNGLGNDEAIATAFPAERILVGVTDHPADFQPPNRVHATGKGHISIGALGGAPDTAVTAVVELLADAGLNAAADSAIDVAIWQKVAFNAALNPLASVTGLTVGGMDCAEGRRIARSIVTEVSVLPPRWILRWMPIPYGRRWNMRWPTIAATRHPCSRM